MVTGNTHFDNTFTPLLWQNASGAVNMLSYTVDADNAPRGLCQCLGPLLEALPGSALAHQDPC